MRHNKNILIMCIEGIGFKINIQVKSRKNVIQPWENSNLAMAMIQIVMWRQLKVHIKEDDTVVEVI